MSQATKSVRSIPVRLAGTTGLEFLQRTQDSARSFSPEQPLSTFLALGDLNGTWTLRADDDTALDSGAIRCWSIIFVPVGACTDGNGVCAGSVPVIAFDSATVSSGNGDDNIDTNE